MKGPFLSTARVFGPWALFAVGFTMWVHGVQRPWPSVVTLIASICFFAFRARHKQNVVDQIEFHDCGPRGTEEGVALAEHYVAHYLEMISVGPFLDVKFDGAVTLPMRGSGTFRRDDGTTVAWAIDGNKKCWLACWTPTDLKQPESLPPLALVSEETLKSWLID